MIVLDASVLIAHLDGDDSHHARARELLAENAAGQFGASDISLAETLVAPARVGRLDDAKLALERLGVSGLQLGPDAPAQLALLRAETNRKLPDCCVLLAAREHDGIVASFDADLIRAAKESGLPTA